ncbi:KAP family NTPase [Campylobacter sp. IFREMER_LSEM_CL2127]|uniref:KAP family P-loop NTPase fold protein n=1 Tax=Campylobacter sp. IFREMER_LSEM_CL2127 TaxID=2911619 RepID=UPI0021E77FF5|nr:KAP family NTPase [Campylobacter sp. IFREMER_LSEM_CL2127]MCV3380863.1 KAP family NTPase [Campylobacter sp. IFREMER_LSEM_CL2127]
MKNKTFKVDKAITSKNEDLFGRKKIAMALARTIKYYKDKDSVSIGIIGDWGSGKTSFINMVLEDFNDDKKFIIINFNPWNISTRKQLISDFFTKLSIEIGRKNTSKRYKKLSNGLKVLSYTFKPFKFIPGLDAFASIASEISDNISNALQEIAEMAEKNLDTTKEEINNAIKKIDKKIIIVIDDLDRLADTDIQEIFQLVRSIADFKNTMYILAYDNEIVTKALDKIQKDKGERYIEKIVQVPIVLPKLNKANLTAIFMQKIEQFNFTYEKFDKNEFIENLNTNNFVGAFENIRDINRYLNVLKFEMSAIKQELYLYDFAVITLFKVFEPKFYGFIYNHFEIFAGTALASYEIDREEQKYIYVKMIDEQMESLNKLNKEIVKNLLIFVFPRIEQLYNRFYTSKNEVEYTYKNRIASRKHFQDYFVLNFAENVIRKETIDKILKANSHQEYDDIFNEYDLKELERFKQLTFKMSIYAKDFKSSEFIYYLWSIFDEFYEEKDFYYFNKCRAYLEIFFILKEKENIVSDKLLDDTYSLDARMLFIYSYNYFMKEKEYLCEKELKILLDKLLQEDSEKVKEKISTHVRVCEKKYNKYFENTFKIFVQNSKIFFLILEKFARKEDGGQKYISQNLSDYFTNYSELKTMIEEAFKNSTDEQKELIEFYKNDLQKKVLRYINPRGYVEK